MAKKAFATGRQSGGKRVVIMANGDVVTPKEFVQSKTKKIEVTSKPVAVEPTVQWASLSRADIAAAGLVRDTSVKLPWYKKLFKRDGK
jgi:hypothetical protein